MNKQYVQEQIKAAIAALREEYDAKIGNIYQCPDCGAVAMRTSEHVCLKGQIPVSVHEPNPERKTINDYLFENLPCNPPKLDETISECSVYTTKSIVSCVLSEGYSGSAGSIESALSKLARAKKIMRKAATIRVTTTSKANKKFEKEISGFVYWKPANDTI